MANTKITSRVLADDAVLTANIADDQITSALIADDVALGGNPTTSTQTAGNNTTRLATTAFVSTAVANIVNSAPSTLDTLGEIATALGNDAALNTTLTNSIATKLPLAGGTMTGALVFGDGKVFKTGDDLVIGTGDTGVAFHDGVDSIIPWNITTAGYRNNAIDIGTSSYGFKDLHLVGNALIGGTLGVTGAITGAKYQTSLNQNSEGISAHFINANSGNAVESVVYITNGASTAEGLFLQSVGTGFSTTGGYVADGCTIGSGTGASGGLSIMSRANADMRFYTNGHTNQRMIIKADGKLGIGTDSPDGNLHVHSGTAGSVTASGDKDELVVESAGHGGISTLTPDASESGMFFGHVSDNRAGEIYTKYSTTTMTLGTRMSGGILAFLSGDGSERMRIDSGGNVGIGTTAPDNLLTVKGAAHAGINIRAGDGYNATLAFSDASGTWYESFIRYRTDTNTLAFDVAGGEKMSITSAGNVGIGTTAPSGILSIPATDTTTKPQIRFMTTGATNLADAALSTTDDSGGTNLLIGSNQYYSGGSIARFDTSRSGTAIDFGYTGRIKFFTGSGNAAPTERMQIDSSGKVGIGTTAPSDTLDLAANGSMGLGIWKSPDGALRAAQKVMYIGTGSSASNSGSSGGNEHGIIQMFHAGDEDIRLYTQGDSWITGGNLGVGTASPSAKLHVYTAGAEGINIGIQNSERYYNLETDGGYLMIKDVSAGGTERMRLHTDGEVVFNSSIADTYSPLVNGITADALVINRHSTSGSLGMWRTNTMEWKVYHNGQGYIMEWQSDGDIGGTFVALSDVNRKENISSITDGTTIIKALRPVKYDWKDSGKSNNNHGFIAQEVETVLPNAVKGNDYVKNLTGLPEDEPENNGKTINESAVLAHAVKAIQELEARIATLEG